MTRSYRVLRLMDWAEPDPLTDRLLAADENWQGLGINIDHGALTGLFQECPAAAWNLETAAYRCTDTFREVIKLMVQFRSYATIDAILLSNTATPMVMGGGFVAPTRALEYCTGGDQPAGATVVVCKPNDRLATEKAVAVERGRRRPFTTAPDCAAVNKNLDRVQVQVSEEPE